MRIHIKAISLEPLEVLPVRRKHLLVTGKKIVRKHIQPTRCYDLGIQHTQRARRAVSWIGECLLAPHLKFGVDLGELGPRKKHLASDLGRSEERRVGKEGR